ncbi:hypothetical protein SLE2022_226060 [Rubroshorea leprosula]
MPLVPSVTELMLAEFLYLQYEDEEKPIYMHMNSTGTQKGGQKLGYETEALAVYDAMRGRSCITFGFWCQRKSFCLSFMPNNDKAANCKASRSSNRC